MLSYDDVLTLVGGFGRHQRVVYSAVCLLRLTMAWDIYTYVFFSYTPDHCCHQSLPVTVSPFDVQAKCQNDANMTSACVKGEEPDAACPAGWEYDSTYFTSTMTTEWGLICSRSWWPGAIQTVFMLGAILGTIVMGAAADIWGRRPAMMLVMLINFFSYVLLTWSPNIIAVAVLRFIVGFTTFSIVAVSGNLILELVSQEWRLTVGLSCWYFYIGGLAVLAGVASLLRVWRRLLTMQAVVQGFIYLYVVCVIPESPRWLLWRGRIEEAQALLCTMARRNKCELDANFQIRAETRPNLPSSWNIRRYPRMALRTMSLCFIWFTSELCLYLMVYLIGNISSDPYVNYAIASLLQFVGFSFMHMLFTMGNRRWPIAAFLFGTSASFLLNQLLLLSQSDTSKARNALVQIGKVFADSATCVLFFYTGEMYPTVIRNFGLGVCVTFGRLGAAIASLLVVPRTSLSLEVSPTVVVCGVGVLLAGLLTFTLPETSHTQLPETLSDGEQLGKDTTSGDKTPLTQAATSQE